MNFTVLEYFCKELQDFCCTSHGLVGEVTCFVSCDDVGNETGFNSFFELYLA
ncbi:hypothetical protein KFK09_007982 [Dendrobium nobile]|uniref:Uncharacterized protein n=1 Tax=Dendrobium nobile TaxID=94219 RepID=A0A8T3BWN1_DENNO|nr:hypothetical protein KFK09_007982 [Dendrobium nobile]